MQRILAIGIAALVLAGCSAAPYTYHAPAPAWPAAEIGAVPSSAAPASSSSYAGWEQFGGWHVKALHDSMDTSTHVRLFTKFDYEPLTPGSRLPGQENMSFGFEIFGNEVVILSPSPGFLGKGSWPYCDYDSSSVSVDGSKAIQLTPVVNPGSCNTVAINGDAVQKLSGGSRAKIRMGSMDGSVSLDGFKTAWARAQELGK